MEKIKAINSDSYWDARFATNWDSQQGPAQSRFFARVAVQNLPSWFLNQLHREALTVCDWGCAQGDGTDVWASHIAADRLTGIDFSSVAIETAAKRYPAIRFICEDWLDPKNPTDGVYDVVFSSNTLEHFYKPYDVLDSIKSKASKAIVLALPFQELERDAEHFYTFLPGNIPANLDDELTLIWSRVIDCRHLPNSLWNGDQIILIYGKSTWVNSLKLRLEDIRIEQNDMSSEIDRIRQAVTERDKKLLEANRIIEEMNETHHEQIRKLINSKSWKVTRPLRAMSRLVKQGRANAADEIDVYHFARSISRRVPLPTWLKSRVRAALLQWRKPQLQGGLPDPMRLSVRTVQRATYGAPSNGSMNAECCALKPGLVSVVLPVFNQAYLLEESIQSVLTQSYQEFELIIINDGSTDGVETVLEKYINHPKVRCYTQDNQRLPKALSNGFSVAQGEFWTWTSADNIMEPRMLELLVGKLRAEVDIGMVYADYYAIDDRGALLQDKGWRAHNRPEPESGEIRLPRTTENLNVVQDNFIGPCFMYRGWIGRCLGDYDPQLGIEDYDYWMRINAFFPIRHLGTPDLLYRYRVHDNTLSAQASEHKILEKAQRLMDYERNRSSYYRASVVIVADTKGLDWATSRGIAVADVLPLHDSSGNLNAEGLARSDLVLLTSASAKTIHAELSELNTPVAILCDGDERKHHKLQRLLNRPGCLALAPTPLSANRIRLVATCPVIDADASYTLAAVVAFAKNHRYFHTTRSAEELQRQPPQHLLRPGGQHVVLQVDSFMQGGMENVVIDLALSLQDTGFQVTIANLGPAGDAADKARESGLRLETLDSHLSATAYVEWLQHERVTLVNAHYSVFGAAACKTAGIPFFETIHNAYVWLDDVAIGRYREADAHVAKYICVSNTVALYADLVLGLNVSKMQVIPNGIDLQNFNAKDFAVNRKQLRSEWSLSSDTPVFLNVASIMATKAQVPLIKAFARVVQQYPDARLILLGSVMEKNYQHAIEKTVRDMKLQRHVIFAGYHRDVARYYHAADVFVLPSYWEGWSLSLGEAMANGLSCVITDVGSAYEFEGHPRVEIVPPPFGDITALHRDNLSRYVYSEDGRFIESLGTSMLRAAGRTRGPLDMELARTLDRHIAYRQYAEAYCSPQING